MVLAVPVGQRYPVGRRVRGRVTRVAGGEGEAEYGIAGLEDGWLHG